MYLDSPENRIFLAPRERVIEVDCPTCLAPKGQTCLGVLRQNGTRRKRESLHRDRYFLYDTSKESSY